MPQTTAVHLACPAKPFERTPLLMFLLFNDRVVCLPFVLTEHSGSQEPRTGCDLASAVIRRARKTEKTAYAVTADTAALDHGDGGFQRTFSHHTGQDCPPVAGLLCSSILMANYLLSAISSPFQVSWSILGVSDAPVDCILQPERR